MALWIEKKNWMAIQYKHSKLAFMDFGPKINKNWPKMYCTHELIYAKEIFFLAKHQPWFKITYLVKFFLGCHFNANFVKSFDAPSGTKIQKLYLKSALESSRTFWTCSNLMKLIIREKRPQVNFTQCRKK